MFASISAAKARVSSGGTSKRLRIGSSSGERMLSGASATRPEMLLNTKASASPGTCADMPTASSYVALIASLSNPWGDTVDASRPSTGYKAVWPRDFYQVAMALMALGDASEDAQRKVESLQEQQSQLLAQIRKALASLPPPDLQTPANNPARAEREEKRRQLIMLLAEIEKRINEENARPKKRYISPATREEVYAVYYDELRHKIEEKGTVNFPEQAGKKLYGELTMVVTVNFDGRILNTEVVQTSGNLTLDRRAQSIVRGTGPFGRFTEAMRRNADQIVVVSRFKFTRDESLETTLTSR